MCPPAMASVSFDQRIPVKDVIIGERYQGSVARVTNYGAYIDLGAERQGFLHVAAMWGRRPRDTLESLRLGRPIWVHVDEVDEVRSFIRLRARGERTDEPLDAEGGLGALHAELVNEYGLGTPDGSRPENGPKPVPINPKSVLQRFGEDIDAIDEEEDDEDADADDDEDEEDDDDDEDDEDDEYELDFDDDHLTSRYNNKASSEMSKYEGIGDADYDDVDDFDTEVDDDESTPLGEVWTEESNIGSRTRFAEAIGDSI
jgi:S1 RNA binding domain